MPRILFLYRETKNKRVCKEQQSRIWLPLGAATWKRQAATDLTARATRSNVFFLEKYVERAVFSFDKKRIFAIGKIVIH